MKDRHYLEVFGKGGLSIRVEDSVVIQTKKNGQKKTVSIQSIESVTIDPPRTLNAGRIVIRTANALDGILVAHFATSDEYPYAENIKEYITEFQANANNSISDPSSTPAICKLDQIAKLKALLDDNAITEDEFETLKKELIG